MKKKTAKKKELKLSAKDLDSILLSLEKAREVLLYYMDSPEWDKDQDEVYEDVKKSIKKLGGVV